MPLIGAAIAAAIAALGRAIVWIFVNWGGTIAANVLLYLGVRFVTHQVTDNFFHDMFSGAFAGLPSGLHDVFAFIRVDVAVSMIVSAALYKLAHSAAMSFTSRRQATGNA